MRHQRQMTDATSVAGTGTGSLSWRRSLIVRVMALCAVLVVCLLGFVYFLTVHYYREVVRDMETRTSEILNELPSFLMENPDDAPERDLLPGEFPQLKVGEKVQILSVATARAEPALPTAPGSIQFRRVIEVNRREYEALVTYARTPQTEIVRAFKNRYLRVLGTVFMITLALMIYSIAKTLRPLRVLSASCAEISEGKLRNVEARGNSSEIVALEQTFNRMVESLKDKEVVEANLRQAQRLAAIGNLAAGVAHDVRNPLNAIKLISSHTLDTIGDSAESEPVAKQLRTIRNEVDRLDDIVSGFLSLAKEEELRLEPRQIDELLEQCARLIAKDAESRGVRLIEELRAGDATLDIDPKQWTRAILNVLINALEACPAGGRVRLFSRVTDDLYEIEVRDDGPGMNAEALEQAFDPYFTTKTTGTGLGLAITRGIVEEHGGTIAISSQEGRGCQVLITIPRNAAVPQDSVMDIARVTAKLKPSDVNGSGFGNIS
jgi:signal transduction histidine kinase